MWTNWSGSLNFEPSAIREPSTEEEVAEIVKKAVKENKKVRVVGAGHSSSNLVETEDILISLSNFKGISEVDNQSYRATVAAGMEIHEAGEELNKAGLAMHNTGDVDVQTVAGAIGTGTHGTGKKLQNLSAMLVGVKIVTGVGDIKEFSIDDDGGLFRALRVALGSLGIFIEMRLQLQPRFKLHRRELYASTDDALANLDNLINNNRNFDFYWYPRSDCVKLRLMNEPGREAEDLPYAQPDKEMQGWSNEILPRTRELKFDEMEYSLPEGKAVDCFQEIRERVKKIHRKYVGWRVLFRTVAADENYLSTIYKRNTVTISLHHNAGLEFRDYFNDIEPVFLKYDGRPHWGKKHNQKAEQLKEMYPEWNKFLEIREQFDPEHVFVSDYISELLGIEK
jgi:FAD/FMN-containing dehydrogenase